MSCYTTQVVQDHIRAHIQQMAEKKENTRYLSVCVERREGSVQHAAAHISVAVVQSIGNEEEEERRDLRFVQVLGQLVQSQSDATPDKGV